MAAEERYDSPPATLAVQPDGIPDQLKHYPQFFCWDWENRSGRWTKPPLKADGTGYAKSTDPATYSTFDAAYAAALSRALAGIGFAVTKSDPICFLDLDHCRDQETGVIDAWAEDVMWSFRSTYHEVSPSGTGIRIIGYGRLPDGAKHTKNIALDARAGAKIELFDDGKYMTLTGHACYGSPQELTDIQASLDVIYAKLFPEKPEEQPVSQPAQPSFEAGADSDDERLAIAFAARNGHNVRALFEGSKSAHGGDNSAADLALCNHLAFYFGPDRARIDRVFRRSGLMRPKWNEVHSGNKATYGQMTIDEALAGRVEFYKPKQPKLRLVGRTAEPTRIGPGDDGDDGGDTGGATPPPEPEEEQAQLTDLGNAKRLIDAHGLDIRYCKVWAKWLVFDGRRWAIDNTMQVERYAQSVVRNFLIEAHGAEDLETRDKLAKHAIASQQARRIAGMIELAKPMVTITPEKLDRDLWLLNCQNGTLDLRTNELRSHDRADYLTKLAPVDYDPNAKASRWEAFMLQVSADDAEQVAFTKRALGYSICGDQSERILLICHGGGRNGKTVMAETVAATLGGDYASTLAAESLMQRRGGDDDRLMQRRAALRGMRFVVASETGEGARLNEALIKSLTGNERITARHLYGEQFEFDPTHTLWLATNHKPGIRDTTNSIWDRMKLIPFSVRFVTDEDATGDPGEIRANKKLGKELLRERQGILAWLVAGCLEWQQNGIGTAKRIKEATQEYRTDEDLLGRFIEECCHVVRKSAIQASQLYGAYTKWCEGNGERPVSQTAFGRALTERGFERKRRESGNEWQGIGLRVNGDDFAKMYGSEGSEPPFDKPPHNTVHADVSGETVQDHTDHTFFGEEQVF